jgi:hypothetical protein
VDSPEGKGCFGPSGSVTRIAPDGTVTTFVDGLPSMVGGEGGQQDTLGPSAIAFGPSGQMYLTVGGGGNPDQRTQVGSPLGDDIGWLLRVTPKGTVVPVQDGIAGVSPDMKTATPTATSALLRADNRGVCERCHNK